MGLKLDNMIFGDTKASYKLQICGPRAVWKLFCSKYLFCTITFNNKLFLKVYVFEIFWQTDRYITIYY